VIGSALYSTFIVLDNIAVLSKLRFLRINQAKIRTLSHLCWFLGTICTAIYRSLVLLALLVKEEHLRLRFLQHSHSILLTDQAEVQSLVSDLTASNNHRPEAGGEHSPRARDSLPKVYNRQQLIEKMDRHNRVKVAHSMELVKNIADMFIGMQLVGISKRVLKYDIGDSFLGLAGITSSLIGIC
jgi:hypothetical protein